MSRTSAEILRWFPTPQAKPESALTLFCLPHAGGDVINFWAWPRHLPPELEVRCAALPGKYGRASEARLPSFSSALDALESMIQPLLNKPYALFGHSMGALLAFELAHRLRLGRQPPLGLFVSGMTSPSLYAASRDATAMSNEEVLDFLRETNGISEEMLVDSGAMRTVIPAVRNDLLLCDTYSYPHTGKLECPTYVFAGRDDSVDPAEIDAWREVIGGRCQTRWFEGGHMFVMTQVEQVTSAITDGLVAFTRGAGRR